MKKLNKNFDDLTKNQALILDCLKQARQPLGAYTILKNLQSKGIRAPLQVYRALDQLADKGLVHKIESLNSWMRSDGNLSPIRSSRFWWDGLNIHPALNPERV